MSLSVGLLPYPRLSPWCFAGFHQPSGTNSITGFSGNLTVLPSQLNADKTRGLQLFTAPVKVYQWINFSDTSSFKSRKAKGSIGHAFTVCIRTENQNQMSIYPFVLHEISVLVELILGPVVPTNAQGISSSGSGSARPFFLRLPLGRARLYLKPKHEASAHHHLVVEPSPYAQGT